MPGSRSYLIDDREKGIFLLDREVHVSEDVLRQEMTHIFSKCWIYVGHGSELEEARRLHDPQGRGTAR